MFPFDDNVYGIMFLGEIHPLFDDSMSPRLHVDTVIYNIFLTTSAPPMQKSNLIKIAKAKKPCVAIFEMRQNII